MAFSFTIRDNKVDDAIQAKDRAVEKALEMIGIQCENYASLLCPVDTGRLRASLTHDVRKSEEAVYVGTNVEYAPYVELGHSQEVGRYVPAIKKRLKKPFVEGKPFLKPAVTNHVKQYKEIAEQCLKNA